MTAFYAVLMFILGVIMTSFYHVISHRVPIKESITKPLYCDTCKHQLRWIDYTPIIGYLYNRGKCNFCKSKIPICYFLIEIIGGSLFMMTYLLYGFTVESIIFLIMISVFITEALSDLKYKYVIDRVWIIGLIPLVVIRVIQDVFFIYLLSSFILFSVLFVIAIIARKFMRKNALGSGDIKLFIFIGFLLTYQQGLLAIFLSAFFALIYSAFITKDRNKEIPLVPFIFFATTFVYFYGQDLIEWYFSIFNI